MKQFHVLADALGLEPGEMLSDYCREWVESTKRRALGLQGVSLDLAPATEPAGE